MAHLVNFVDRQDMCHRRLARRCFSFNAQVDRRKIPAFRAVTGDCPYVRKDKAYRVFMNTVQREIAMRAAVLEVDGVAAPFMGAFRRRLKPKDLPTCSARSTGGQAARVPTDSVQNLNIR